MWHPQVGTGSLAIIFIVSVLTSTLLQPLQCNPSITAAGKSFGSPASSQKHQESPFHSRWTRDYPRKHPPPKHLPATLDHLDDVYVQNVFPQYAVQKSEQPALQTHPEEKSYKGDILFWLKVADYVNSVITALDCVPKEAIDDGCIVFYDREKSIGEMPAFTGQPTDPVIIAVKGFLHEFAEIVERDYYILTTDTPLEANEYTLFGIKLRMNVRMPSEYSPAVAALRAVSTAQPGQKDKHAVAEKSEYAILFRERKLQTTSQTKTLTLPMRAKEVWSYLFVYTLQKFFSEIVRASWARLMARKAGEIRKRRPKNAGDPAEMDVIKAQVQSMENVETAWKIVKSRLLVGYKELRENVETKPLRITFKKYWDYRYAPAVEGCPSDPPSSPTALPALFSALRMKISRTLHHVGSETSPLGIGASHNGKFLVNAVHSIRPVSKWTLLLLPITPSAQELDNMMVHSILSKLDLQAISTETEQIISEVEKLRSFPKEDAGLRVLLADIRRAVKMGRDAVFEWMVSVALRSLKSEMMAPFKPRGAAEWEKFNRRLPHSFISMQAIWYVMRLFCAKHSTELKRVRKHLREWDKPTLVDELAAREDFRYWVFALTRYYQIEYDRQLVVAKGAKGAKGKADRTTGDKTSNVRVSAGGAGGGGGKNGHGEEKGPILGRFFSWRRAKKGVKRRRRRRKRFVNPVGLGGLLVFLIGFFVIYIYGATMRMRTVAPRELQLDAQKQDDQPEIGGAVLRVLGDGMKEEDDDGDEIEDIGDEEKEEARSSNTTLRQGGQRKGWGEQR